MEEGDNKSNEEELMDTDTVAMPTDKPSESGETKDSKDEYNPLIVRRYVPRSIPVLLQKY